MCRWVPWSVLLAEFVSELEKINVDELLALDAGVSGGLVEAGLELGRFRLGVLFVNPPNVAFKRVPREGERILGVVRGGGQPLGRLERDELFPVDERPEEVSEETLGILGGEPG